MAYINEEVKVFDKGTVTVVDSDVISRGAASRTRNMLNVGDAFEIVPGATLLGTALGASGRVAGLGVSQDLLGNDVLTRVRDTYVEVYDADADSWTEVKNDMTDDSDTGIFGYQTPAGSFQVITSKYDGPLRINLANPTSISDHYNSSHNFRGIVPIYNNRAYAMQRIGYETVLYMGYIDNNYPYTAITTENIGTGDDSTVTFGATLAHIYVVARSITVTAGAVTGTDNGSGVISGSGITGTINYTTGAISVTFTTPPAGAVTIDVDYSYEQPTNEGILDFFYGSPRVAGQGDVIPQYEGSDPIQFVVYFKGVHYVFHKRSIWTVTISDDDTTLVNVVFRSNTGAASWRSVKATNEGIYYVDQVDDNKPVIRFLRYSDLSGETLPEEISVNVDLSGYNFDDAACEEWEDFILWVCKSPGATNNDTMIYYNKRWKTIDFGEGYYRCLVRGTDALYGGSSISGDVYRLFDGYHIDDIDIIGEWDGRNDDIDIEELKKCKKFIVEGDMQDTQKLRVEVSFDGSDPEVLGTVTDDDFLLGSGSTAYGALLYGAASGGGTGVKTKHFLKEMRFGRTKFLRALPKFVAYGTGFIRVKMYVFKDVRKKGFKLPNKFR